MSNDTHTAGAGRSLSTLAFSFVIPIVVIGALVRYVATPGHGAAEGGDTAMAVEARIQKIGSVTIKDGNRKLVSGEEVFKAQCTTCHTAGVAGAPKFGDAAAWAPRIKTGFEALLTSALKGKGAMGAQGGGNFEDIEVARAVVYMANGGGAKFDEPAAPAPAGGASAPAAGASAPAAAK